MEKTNLFNKHSDFDPFAGPEIEHVVQTTKPQSEIWIACKMGDNDANRAYNESVTLILKGKLNKVALIDALQNLVDRHQALRSVFSTDGRFMTVFKKLDIALNYQDLSEFSEFDKSTALKDYLIADANYVFDLVKGPLLKVGLIKVLENEHHLILTGHHIICDGWSIGIMLQEIGGLYSANVLNTNHHLPKEESFVTYADEQQTYLSSEEHTINENYWLNQFKGEVPQLTLPTDFPRPETRSYKSERLDLAMDMKLVNALKETGIKAGASFVTTLLSAFEIFLYKQTGQGSIVLGLPSADQAASGKTQMIGHCVNLLPLSSKISPNISFHDYLKQRKIQLFDAYEHQKFSFGELLQKLSIARDPSRVPLAPVVFNIDMGMTDGVSFTDLSYELKSNPRAFETFEIFLNASGSAEHLVVEWSYNSNLFKPETIQQMMATFEAIISEVVADPTTKIGDIVKVDDSAYLKLNNTKKEYPQLPLHELISQASDIHKSKTAIKFGDDELSYETFNHKVNQLSHALLEIGIEPGDIIGVALSRTTEVVIALVAIMRCGAIYLPLDPEFPTQRLDFMFSDSGANILLTSKTLSGLLSTTEVYFIEDLFEKLETFPKDPISLKINNTEIIYIYYTSGSTGQPKGVPISHKGLVNFLYSMMDAPGINASDRVLSLTTISFDIAGLELFLPLLSGATLVIANDEISKDGRLLLEFIENEAITMVQTTPTRWQMLLDSGWTKSYPIKGLIGGEHLSKSLADNLLAKIDELWNVYGPTETTVWCTTKQIKLEDKIITVGHPIANMQIYILNEQGLLMKPDTIGEIVIGGDGISDGYIKRDDLTSEKFVPNHIDLQSSSTLYHSGDLGKLLPSGEIQCLGRMDDQVKIRGHRIELGEIEEVLNSIEEIDFSIVLVDNEQLKAFVATKDRTDGSPNIDQWKTELNKHLPYYMVPNSITQVAEFPKTLSGKIDRKALLRQSNAAIENSSDFTAPRNITEQLISDIWTESLNIKNIDIHSNFFELGGHSLIAVKVMALIEKETGKRLPLATLMTHSTIEKMAQFMEMDNDTETWDSLVPIQSLGNKTPVYVVHGGDHNILIFKLLSNKLDPDQPLYGLQARGLNGIDEPHSKVEDMAAHYISEILKSNPKGPYALAGYSFGGIIAFEMARQLKAQNKEVKIVVLLDSYVYPNYYHSNSLRKSVAHTKYLMGKMFFMSRKMLRNKSNFIDRVHSWKDDIKNMYSRLKLGNEQHHQSLYSWPYKLDVMHNQAINNYHIVPSDIKVHLLKVAEDDIFFAHDTNYLGWSKVAMGGIEKHIIPGNHKNLLSPPNDEALGKTLQSLLDKIDG